MTPREIIGGFADVPLRIEAELARCTIQVKDLIALEVGSVIATDRPAGEDLDVMVGGSRIGTGEVVVVGNSAGIRMTSFRNKKEKGIVTGLEGSL
jgi:flagellar motor switch protein FliN